jgi:carnitine 3-dehydrogenase
MRVGLLGGGVIGGGWAARFVLNGVDVRLYDPDPDAPRQVDLMLENARRALGRLTYAPLPAPGELTFVATPEEAAAGATFIQENAPERLGLKRELLAAASRVAPPEVVIASSTSGLLPSLLQEGIEHPERLTVGHPFDPVYLLPLVEICGGNATAPETIEHAAELYRSVGMHPLVVRREVDGCIADRLLEALWREALWLVHDDIATVDEVDDAIRFGPGLRWSSMGTFLLYRIAGGDEGMRHFLEQLGPALQWPWSRLTDVPDLTDELIGRIVEQSDAQAAERSLRELERLRDDCLVDVLQALRANGVGAGQTVADHERALIGRAPAAGGDAFVWETRVLPEWVDYNGHATESSYLLMTSHAADELLRSIGIDADYLRAGGSYYTVETHLCHLGEAKAGERLHVATQVLGADEKRIHIFVRIARDDTLLATTEQMLLHVDTKAGRAASAPPEVLARVYALVESHASRPWPERAGRHVALPSGAPA